MSFLSDLGRGPQDTHIRRHKKILAKANPFDPKFKEYFEQRNKERKACAYAAKATNSTGLKYIQSYAGLSGVR
jgi:RNA-directed DNA polymerase